MFRLKSKAKLRSPNSQAPGVQSPPVPPPTGPSLSQPSPLPVPAPASPIPQPPPVTQEVVLSWPSTNTETNTESTPSEAPPDYAVARYPVRPVRYQFSSVGSNSMILLPPETAPDTRPVYHITVSMNCFVPYSYITTLRRGGTEAGEYVGDFELGATCDPDLRTPTICLRGREYPMTTSIEVKRSGGSRYYAPPHLCAPPCFALFPFP
ncbi:hypothetical protein P691DRAFT_724711 [Macrolepiota fuliginosa MF-IS2]|uniref:Uncharacterized protein n=1 Tax=Macrolepiota fuliginosa MF-IS2 TaxID=1400762 RepID=A0A9P5XKF5_9AGAR|nr:hypothetical protein P691DRAFT_724711 [Macrolepiota fuliginosa MF-IS2]